MIYALLMRTTPSSRPGEADLAQRFQFQQYLSLTRFRITDDLLGAHQTQLSQRPLQKGIEIFHSTGEQFRWKSAEQEHRWRRYQEAHDAEASLHILCIDHHPQHLSCFPHGHVRGKILLICVSSNQCVYHPRPPSSDCELRPLHRCSLIR